MNIMLPRPLITGLMKKQVLPSVKNLLIPYIETQKKRVKFQWALIFDVFKGPTIQRKMVFVPNN